MTSDERRDSLADQAAAWVPPWDRAVVAPPPAEQPSAALRAAVGATPEEPDPEESPVDQPVTDEPPAGGTQEVETPAIPTTAPPVEAVPAVESPEEGAPPDGAPVDAPVDTGPVDVPLVDVPPPSTAAGVPPAAPDPGMPDPGRPRAGVPGPRPAATLDLIDDDDELRAALEAILLVVDEPVAEIVLAQVLEQPTERVAATLQRLAGDYTAAGHGFELRRAAGGWRLYTRPEYAAYVERFVLDGQSVRLTQAALETLAVVAYKQPVTRSRISAIRGVNCDGVIRTLVTRGLVEECGSEPGSGAFLYRTTTLFLEKLGLDTVDELPPLAPFLPDDLEEIADAPR